MVGGYRIGVHLLSSVLRFLEPRLDDDLVDRLHYLYTSSMLLCFALLVSAKQYAGHPIECFVPAQFTRAMEQYTENYCWVQNTYWVPFQDLIPHRLDDRERRQIGYYQWAPFILILAALIFHVPSSIWRHLSPQSGLNVSVILQLACEQGNLDPDERNRTVDILARHVDDALSFQRDRGASGRSEYFFSLLKLGKVHGSYVQTVYLFVKCLQLLNVLLQFALLNQFLDTADYPFFGVHVLYDLFMGREWRDSGKFPRVTLCDFEIRVLGNIHRHTVQCVLVINMFTEKIFICLWLWLCFLAFLSAVNFLLRVAELLSSNAQQSYVRSQLTIDSEHLPRFVSRFLRPDGVFLLRLLSAHAGSLFSARLTTALWAIFLRRIECAMGQYMGAFRRKEELVGEKCSSDTVVRPKKVFAVGIEDLIGSFIPAAFLVHETASSEYIDEDGDVANEFYKEEVQVDGKGCSLKRLTENLTPQKTEKYQIPRLRHDLPVVLVQVQ